MSDLSRCPVCQSHSVLEVSQPRGDTTEFHCGNCGIFRITGTVEAVLRNKRQQQPGFDNLLAHYIRRADGSLLRPVEVTRELIDRAYAGRYPNAMEQLENLVIWLAETSPYAGSQTNIEYAEHQAITGAGSARSFAWLLEAALERGWIDGQFVKTKDDPGALSQASLTLSGWEWYEDFGRHKGSKIGFMAMKYGDPVLDDIVDRHFRPAVDRTGFTLRRLDDEPKAGLIDNRLRVEIRRSRFLVCDVSHGNLGAYWEAGFAEGLGRPVIYTCDEREFTKLHFDVRNCQIIPWSAAKPQGAADQLAATIRNSLPDEAVLTD